MPSAQRRLFVLLGAYEDLTDRETSALRRGDIHYVLSIQERKSRLTTALQEVRDATALSSAETAAWSDRIRALQTREEGNLTVLRDHMAQTRQALGEIGQATQRSRNVRRGYSGYGAGRRAAGEGILGRA